MADPAVRWHSILQGRGRAGRTARCGQTGLRARTHAQKLLERPRLCTPSALDGAATAIELLGELWGHPGACSTVADSATRILVVDDDPIALRAISTSVQLVFGRPDKAENGQEALALAAEKPYDLILLDVMMPGIDGFSTCEKIHETTPNSHTPVVFVTSHDVAAARSRALSCGGSGLIPKPVLASQIALTALTFILKARFNKPQLPALEETAGLAAAFSSSAMTNWPPPVRGPVGRLPHNSTTPLVAGRSRGGGKRPLPPWTPGDLSVTVGMGLVLMITTVVIGIARFIGIKTASNPIPLCLLCLFVAASTAVSRILIGASS